MHPLSLSDARDALVAGGITGTHKSHERRKSIEKIESLLEGDPDATFGLSGVESYPAGEILAFVADVMGCSADMSDLASEDRIDPDLTIQGIVAAGERLKRAADEGALLLVATGHPTGLLHHHIRVVEAYRRAGGKVVQLREEESLPIGKRGKELEVRYVGGVGCLSDWGSLRHTHSPAAMEALLEADPWPDLVLGDHGFAGAAIERAIPTVAVSDINDHALAVAAGQKRDVVLLPMDDNRPPRFYEPSWRLIEQILAGIPTS